MGKAGGEIVRYKMQKLITESKLAMAPLGEIRTSADVMALKMLASVGVGVGVGTPNLKA